MIETQFPFMGHGKRREPLRLPTASLRGCLTPNARGGKCNEMCFRERVPWLVKDVSRGAEAPGI